MPKARIEDLIGYQAQYPPTHWSAGHLRFVGEDVTIVPPNEFEEEAERRLEKRSTHHVAPSSASSSSSSSSLTGGWYSWFDGLHFFTPFWIRFKAKLVFNVCAWLLCLIQIGPC